MHERSQHHLCFLAVCATLLLNVPAVSQTFFTHSYTVEDGLNSLVIKDIAQDLRGRMWFATRSGVAMYDGFSWEHFTDVRGIYDHDFLSIRCDRENRIYVLSRWPDPKIWVYDHTWNELKAPIVPATARQGANALEIAHNDDEVELMIGFDHAGVYHYRGGSWNHLSQQNGLPDDTVRVITSWRDKFYLGTMNGVTRIQGGDVSANFNATLGVSSQPIYGIAIEDYSMYSFDEDSLRFWLYGDGWLGVSDYGEFRIIHPDLSDHGDNSVVLCPDTKGNVFLGSAHTLHFYENRTGEIHRYGLQNGLLSNGANSIFVDREQNTWFATTRGISKIASRRFANYQTQHGLFSDEVSAISIVDETRMWLGHNRGITLKEGTQFRHFPIELDHTADDRFTQILDMSIDSNGTLYAAASSVGLITISNYQELNVLHSSEDLSYTSSVFVDSRNRIWLGCADGIYQLRNGQIIPVDMGEIPRLTYIRRIGERSNGDILFATVGRGLLVYDAEGNWHAIKNKADPLANQLYTVLECAAKNVWIGTAVGLFQLADSVLVPAQIAGIGQGSPVYALVQDRSEQLWLGRRKGVARWDGKRVINYSSASGLVGQELNRAVMVEDENGYIWIGTDAGLSCYQADFDQVNESPPYVEILRAEIGSEVFSTDRPLSLDWDQNSVTFYYRGISFHNERATRYQVCLRGFDKGFINADHSDGGKRRYTNLPPGSYRFAVRARTPLGEWSNPLSTAPIEIHLPFWKSGWFALLLILGAAAVIGYVRWTYVKQKYHRDLHSRYEQQTRELYISEQKYRTLFEEMADVIYISTPAGRFVDVNPAGLTLFGYDTLDDLLAVDIPRDIWQDEAERAEMAKALAESGYVNNLELRLKRSDGAAINVLCTASAVYDAGGTVIAFRGILRDVTEKHRLEEQLRLSEKMKSIGMLAGGIAHDFNNLLSGILGYASFMKEEMDPTTAHYRYVRTIEQSAQRAARLTSQLLGFARGGKYEKKPVDLNRLVSTVLNMISPTIESDLKVEPELDNDLLTVEGDSTQLEQVVMNLCMNAKDAMPDGGILRVKTMVTEPVNSRDIEGDSRSGKRVCLSVSDTGVGMTEEVRQHIFDPFFTTKQKGKGTGLGLAMLYGVVEKHGGHIEVDSTPGAGSEFRLYFPATDEKVAVKPSVRSTNNPGDETVLVVDDDEVVRDIISATLRRSGYRIHLAKDGLEALEQYQRHASEIDLILLDVLMPKMSGPEALDELRTMKAEVPVIVITGYNEDASFNVSDGRVAGFIQKPFATADLLSQIRAVLDS